MQNQIHSTANYLRYVAGSGTNYAIASLDTFLPVDSGSSPVCISCGVKNLGGAEFQGDGSNRAFGVNQYTVRTLQYGVINLDYNSVVGLNYVGKTHQINSKGEVTREGRASNGNMFWSEGNLSPNGGSNYTSIGASTSAGNPLVVGAPAIDYTTNIKIAGKQYVTVTTSLDKFPAYEGYLSINGGPFNTLYQYKAVGGFSNLYNNRGKFTRTFKYL
ncbi:DUF3238 domain-containing protein [Cohnella sp. GCM10020058]|uniref:DUF3238 domain-containing protein n=1 Tax=Cohnella sp. GCM10020058 TaxID=3317330 RepID=UPI003635AF74